MLSISVSVLLFNLIINVCLVSNQFFQQPSSPCPDIFQYRNDGGETYGYITFYLSQPATTVTIMTNFTVATALPSRYIGRLEAQGTELEILRQGNQGQPISYKVHFPVTSPLPRITQITVNGGVICYGEGDSIRPGVYVTTLSLRHSLYLKSGTIPINKEFFANGIPSHHNTNTFTNSVHQNRPTHFDDDGDFVENKDPNIFWNGSNNNRPFNDPNFYEVVMTRPRKTTTERANVFDRPFNDGFYDYVTPPPENTPRPLPPPPRPQRPRPQPQPTTEPPYTLSECGVVAGGNEQIALIQNGESYSRGDWPWLVAIYKKKDLTLSFICSGTLVSDRHVVSAAHCMKQKNTQTSTRDIVVKVGVYNLEDWSDDVTVTRRLSAATIHSSYNAKTLSNDIMLMTMERRVEFNYNIRAACLWEGDNDLRRIVGATGVVTGWGRSEFGNGGTGEPRMVRVPIVSTTDCRASRPDFHKLTSDNTICAGDRNGSGPCLGDSGGGLYILEGGRWRIRGVVSLSLRPDNGDNTCNLNEYVVFTDTAKYLTWIYSNM